MDIRGDNITFDPGIYVITGFMDIRGTNMTMNGVTFFFTCSSYPTSTCSPGQGGGSFNFHGSGTSTISPPSSGPYAASPGFTGIPFFVDRNNVGATSTCDDFRFLSGTINTTGSFYGKSACVRISAGGAFSGGIVASRVLVTGGTMTVG
jgi:hypothetical protein